MSLTKKLVRPVIVKILQLQVRRLVKKRRPLVVAVTGSVGKTTTKLAIAKVLAAKYRVAVHPGNFNTDIGLPLAVFDIDTPTRTSSLMAWIKIIQAARRKVRDPNYPYDAWVLELGADHPGEIKAFMRYLEPDIGVVTAIAPAHLEGFKTIEAIEAEKMQLARGSRQVLLNSDDKRLSKYIGQLGTKPTFGYGFKTGGFRLSSQDYSFKSGYKVELELQEIKISTQLKLMARHSLYAALAAAAVGHLLGLPDSQIKQQLAKLEPMSGRMNPLPGAKGSLIIDDSYNASPAAVAAALEALYELPVQGRRMAILGTMNEMGRESRASHQEAGRRSKQLDLLVTIGDEARDYLAPAATKAGLSARKVKSFDSPFEAGQFVAGKLKAGDVVLVKGSQNKVFSEEAAALLLADPADRSKLVRQSVSWLQKKQEQFPDGTATLQNAIIFELQRQQSASSEVGHFMGERFCAPTCFYIVAKAYRYVPVDFATFCRELDWGSSYIPEKGWLRAELSNWMRQKYQVPVVTWQLHPPKNKHNYDLMRKLGYVVTDREMKFFKSQVEGRSVKQLVQKGHPVVITAQAGFGGNGYLHAVAIRGWKEGRVEVTDPDERNFRTHYSEADVKKYLLAQNSVCTIVLPPEAEA